MRSFISTTLTAKPMQPGRKSRFAPESSDLPEKLEERFLRQVFCFGGIAHHPQTERIDPAAVQTVQAFKSRRIALLGEPDRFCLRQFPSVRFVSFGPRYPSGRIHTVRCVARSLSCTCRALACCDSAKVRRMACAAPCESLRLGCIRRHGKHLIILAGFAGNVQPEESKGYCQAGAARCDLRVRQEHGLAVPGVGEVVNQKFSQFRRARLPQVAMGASGDAGEASSAQSRNVVGRQDARRRDFKTTSDSRRQVLKS